MAHAMPSSYLHYKLQHTARHHNNRTTLRQTATQVIFIFVLRLPICTIFRIHICITNSNAAANCSTLQYIATIATRCNSLQLTATRCNTLQHAATRCNTLQHMPYAQLRCESLIHMWRVSFRCAIQLARGRSGTPHSVTHYNTLQHTATHCDTLQHTTSHCITLQQTWHIIFAAAIYEGVHGACWMIARVVYTACACQIEGVSKRFYHHRVRDSFLKYHYALIDCTGRKHCQCISKRGCAQTILLTSSS